MALDIAMDLEVRYAPFVSFSGVGVGGALPTMYRSHFTESAQVPRGDRLDSIR